MSQRVIVSTCVIVKDDCPIQFNIINNDQVEVVCDQPRDGFDFVISTGALRTFIESGKAALAAMAALATTEEAADELETSA